METERPLTIACHMKIFEYLYLCCHYSLFKPGETLKKLFVSHNCYTNVAPDFMINKQLILTFIIAKRLSFLLKALTALAFTTIF